MNLYVQSDSVAARRKFTFVCVDDADGKTPKTGLTFSSSEVSVRKPAGSYAAITNIATIAEVADGEYEGEFTATELNTLGPLLVKVKKTNVRTTIIAIGQVVAANVYDSVRLGLTALPNAAAEASGGIITRGSGTGQLVVSGGNANASVQSLANNTVTAAAVAADAVVEIQAGLAVQTTLNDVYTYVANLPTSPASTDDIDSAVAGLATASAVAAIPTNPLLTTDARLANLDAPISGIDTASLAAAIAAIPADVWQRVLDANAPANAQTAEQILNLIASVSYGPKTENDDGSVTIRDPGDTKDRITGNVVNGVRTLAGADGS